MGGTVCGPSSQMAASASVSTSTSRSSPGTQSAQRPQSAPLSSVAASGVPRQWHHSPGLSLPQDCAVHLDCGWCPLLGSEGLAENLPTDPRSPKDVARGPPCFCTMEEVGREHSLLAQQLGQRSCLLRPSGSGGRCSALGACQVPTKALLRTQLSVPADTPAFHTTPGALSLGPEAPGPSAHLPVPGIRLRDT